MKTYCLNDREFKIAALKKMRCKKTQADSLMNSETKSTNKMSTLQKR